MGRKKIALIVMVLIMASIGIWYVRPIPTPTPTPMPTPVPKSITFDVSKDGFASGEPVEFTIKNVGQTTIYLPNTAPWHVERKEEKLRLVRIKLPGIPAREITIGEDGEWRPVFSPISLPTKTALEPGKSLSWSWSQTNYTREQVPPGIYRMGISWDDHISYSGEFVIGALEYQR
ncbi:MAG: hypothetical protein QMC85_07240 [Methanocellales archaeon]|nr:hypothetical protein [Methanocellales archaeon]